MDNFEKGLTALTQKDIYIYRIYIGFVINMKETIYTTASFQKETMDRIRSIDKYHIGVNKTVTHLLDMYDEFRNDPNNEVDFRW